MPRNCAEIVLVNICRRPREPASRCIESLAYSAQKVKETKVRSERVVRMGDKDKLEMASLLFLDLLEGVLDEVESS
jgi:hypothetical protein